MADIIKYRTATAEDLRFVVDSWISSYASAHTAGMLSIDPLIIPCECGNPIDYSFGAVMEPTIKNILQRPGLLVWVAYDPRQEVPNEIYGYIVVETGANVPRYEQRGRDEVIKHIDTSPDPFVHYVYVKSSCRHFGIASGLFKVAGIDPKSPFKYSCKTPSSTRIQSAGKIPRASWYPLSIRFSKTRKTS